MSIQVLSVIFKTQYLYLYWHSGLAFLSLIYWDTISRRMMANHFEIIPIIPIILWLLNVAIVSVPISLKKWQFTLNPEIMEFHMAYLLILGFIIDSIILIFISISLISISRWFVQTRLHLWRIQGNHQWAGNK